MTRVFVVGANGRLGRTVVTRALAEGHEVTAFVRNAGTLPDHPALTITSGSVTEQPDAVRRAVRGHDAILSALGNPLWLKGMRGPAILADAMTNLVTAAQASGVARLVLPVAWGTGLSRTAASPLVRVIAATLIRRDFRDFDAAERVVAESDLKWTIAYFGALTDAAPTSRWSASTLIRTPKPLAIARADVAEFLVSSLEDESVAAQRVVLSGAGQQLSTPTILREP
ncbi:NAD(P)-dependent oxidoreductase [Lentzea cavernae]|uniref:NAD-dependent epimerase n=1 Tax=Lentzea cavernae TaxID=2020703 RepID=A0ABQ3MCD6_9PSEU|nr:NAD(P)-binding oxidoreductase [Lentzea cavernae]GHH39236.1 NAD-dependent epimerase [Lentzea cavernae]